MRIRLFAMVVVVSLVALLGCGKESSKTSGSGAPAASAAPTIPTKVTIKANFEEFNGEYDGTNVVALKSADGSIEVSLQRGCAKPLGCDVWDVDAVARDCPKGFVASVKPKKPALGKSTEIVSLYGVAEKSTGMISENTLEITKLTDTEIAGTLTGPPDDATSAKGAFTAKICPPDK